MVDNEPRYVARDILPVVLAALSDIGSGRVCIVGPPGSGKTVLLRTLQAQLAREGRDVFFVSSSGVGSEQDLALAIMAAIDHSPHAATVNSERTLRSSAGGVLLPETASLLRSAATVLQSPVLIIDALDEAVYPGRIAVAINVLGSALGEWGIAVAIRDFSAVQPSSFSLFNVVALRALTYGESVALLRANDYDFTNADTERIFAASGGNPMVLSLMARFAKTSGPNGQPVGPAGFSIPMYVDEMIGASQDPPKARALLEYLALVGDRESLAVLAKRANLSGDVLHRLLRDLTSILQNNINGDHSVALFHTAIGQAIREHLMNAHPFRLNDLKFGSEEAERDELLGSSYVSHVDVRDIIDRGRTIIIGDRGSGKSALFRRLSEQQVSIDDRPVRFFAIADLSAALHRVVPSDSWHDVEALRAAFLVVLAAEIAEAVPSTASRETRSSGSDLRRALGFPVDRPRLWRRLLLSIVRPFVGATLKFTIGPVSLESKLGSGSGRLGRGAIDVEAFLREVDGILSSSSQRIVVLVDRIDEVSKYDRSKQEAIVQSLLQVESRASSLQNVRLILFLRTDLFELYDIQEKNKLVSRMLVLKWSPEQWLEILIRRLYASPVLEWLTERILLADVHADLIGAFGTEVLFPKLIEDKPINNWLLDSLRNGNGDISPRLAVLFLHLARDASPKPGDVVTSFPLFSVESCKRAMTMLSDLAYSEVVNDFQVSRAFVLNCRAGKLQSFSLAEVEGLFDPLEGAISEQIRLLERLGFLERVVRGSNAQSRFFFKIPRLYTRCWDHE